MKRAELIEFPASRAARPPLPACQPRRREYALGDMVELLALDDLEQRTVIDRLRKLADQSGLPLPKNTRQWAGRIMRGSKVICAASRWCALAVDAWLDGQGPHGGTAMPATGVAGVTAAAPGNIHHIMQHRARALRQA